MLRRLLDTGYRVGASVVGAGLTTPSGRYVGSWAAVTPKVTIDQVSADTRVEVLRLPCSAYRTPTTVVLAELVLPPG